MSEKRYQVFISSTFRDLVDERREIVQALLEMDCIPAGMELFPAANDDAWTLIKRVIDQSDYYVLVVGGRYGSTDAEGISFTEREYDYAVAAGKTVLPFLHEDPGKIAAEKSELNGDAQKKLTAFRGKVEKAHHCKFWNSADDLGSKVSRAMLQATRTTPAIGWIRANEAAGPEMLAEINRLRLLNDSLRDELRAARTEAPKGIEGLMQGRDTIPIKFSFHAYSDDELKLRATQYVSGSTFSMPLPLNWDQVFGVVGPRMLAEATEISMKETIESKIHLSFPIGSWYRTHGGSKPKLADDDFQTLKMQLIALGLIRKSDRKRAISDRGTYWTLTPYGEDYLIRLRALTKDDDDELEFDDGIMDEGDDKSDEADADSEEGST